MRFVLLVPEKVWKLVGYKLETVVYVAFMYFTTVNRQILRMLT